MPVPRLLKVPELICQGCPAPWLPRLHLDLLHAEAKVHAGILERCCQPPISAYGLNMSQLPY